MIQLEVQSPSYNKLLAASSVPVGKSGKIHVWGKNDMATSQVMIIGWIVQDPDSALVESYGDDAGTIGAEQTHEFIGSGSFDLDKLGTYTIAVKLFMNRASPVVVDSYDGPLCTTTTEVPPEYELLEEVIYPYAYIYEGEVEESTFTFTSIPFTPSSWVKGIFASRCEEEVRKAGGQMLEMRIYTDESLWRPWTNWRIECVVVPPPIAAGAGRATGIYWLGAILLTVLAIVFVLVVTWGIVTIVRQFKRKVSLEDVKPSWGKETLIQAIQDSEAFWERAPTSLETLEAKAEEELRVYLDKIAEEEVPLGPNWMPWLIGGGVAVLGIGAIAMLAGKKKK